MHVRYITPCGNCTMPSGHYIKHQNMLGKCLFLPLWWFKSHLKYDFLTHSGPIYLPIKYRNFAQSPFKGTVQSFKIRAKLLENGSLMTVLMSCLSCLFYDVWTHILNIALTSHAFCSCWLLSFQVWIFFWFSLSIHLVVCAGDAKHICI